MPLFHQPDIKPDGRRQLIHGVAGDGVPDLRVLADCADIGRHSLAPRLIVPVNLIFDSQHRHAQKIISNLRLEIIDVLVPADKEQTFRQKPDLVHVPFIIFPCDRFVVDPVMIRIKILQHTELLRVQEHRKRNLQIFPQRHALIAVFHIFPQKLRAEQLGDARRLQSPAEEIPVIDKGGKQIFHLSAAVDLPPEI